MSIVRVVSSHPGSAPLTLERLNHLFGGSGSGAQFLDASSSPVEVAEKFKQSIFIGVGGTGQKILRRLKAKMYIRLNCGFLLPMVRWTRRPRKTLSHPWHRLCTKVASKYGFVHTPVMRCEVHAEVHKAGRLPCSHLIASWLPKTSLLSCDGRRKANGVVRFALLR